MSFARITAVSLLSAWMLVACCLGFARDPKNSRSAEARNEQVEAVLDNLNDGKKSSYEDGWFDLDANGEQEAVIMMMGPNWCGTGGCTLMILKRDATSWRVVSQIPTCRLPVVVLSGKTNGWHDLGVTTQGGGDTARKQVVLKFQGNGYVKDLESQPIGGQTIIPGT